MGLFGALQKIADLVSGGNLDGEFFPEKQRKLIAEQHLAGISYRDGQQIVVNFKRHEVVTEHQVRGNGAEKLEVDALLAKINEGAAVALRKFAGEFTLVLFLGGAC